MGLQPSSPLLWQAGLGPWTMSSCAPVWPVLPSSTKLPKKKAQVGSSKKAEQKKKEKIIKDKTFVLKDKKEAKQKFIKAVTHQVKFGHQNSHQIAQSETEKKLRKDDKKKELQELNELFKTAVSAQKISKGAASPQAVVCAFFK